MLQRQALCGHQLVLTRLLAVADNQPRDWPAKTRWAKELNDINFSIDDGHNRFRSGLQWMEVFEEQAKAEGGTQSDNHGRRRLFEYPLKDAKIPWTVWLSEEALWERYATLSHISRLEGAARDNVVRAFKDIMKGEDVERNELGQVAVHGNTYLAWTLRL